MGRRARQSAVGRLAIATPPTASPSNVFIVDADQNQRRALAIGLRVHGHHTEEASAAAECLSHPALREADLIVVARFLPDMSGDELAVRLARRHPNARIAIVANEDDEAATPSPLFVEFASAAVLARPLRTEDVLIVLAGGLRGSSR